MVSIQDQAKKLVDTFIETSNKTKAGFFPFKDLQLYVMNTATLITFGKTFSTKDDPKFIEISESIDEGFKYLGVDYDLANYLPIFTVYDYFKGIRKMLKNFLNKTRDPIFRSLIEEAHHTDVPNLVKYLKENGYNLSEEETIVISCKCFFFFKKYHLTSFFCCISGFDWSRNRYKHCVFMLDDCYHVPPSRGSDKNCC